jgi:long-chain-fatty-acid---luciferin-component ligase
VALVGPPVLLASFVRSRPDRPLPASLRDRVVVMSAGGWKTPNGPPTTPDGFRRDVVEGLGLGGERQVRDAFSQVELNTVLAECDQHRKHVPPWLHVTVRHPGTLERLPNGEPGLLSYLDPTASSFPCFVIADDLGTVEDDGCSCGRKGRVLRILRRIEREESWGCALKLAETPEVDHT